MLSAGAGQSCALSSIVNNCKWFIYVFRYLMLIVKNKRERGVVCVGHQR